VGAANLPADDHLFISYSRFDGEELAGRLANRLSADPSPLRVWIDREGIKPGRARDWDDQVDEAIRTCAAFLFLMTTDSVQPQSVCKLEWMRALSLKKPVIPLKAADGVRPPFGLQGRQHVDFSDPGRFDQALAELRDLLGWLASDEGMLQLLLDRLEDARRGLDRARDPSGRSRAKLELEALEQQIRAQRFAVVDPDRAKRSVERRISAALEDERRPGRRGGSIVNEPPGVAPVYFQDRLIESGIVADFLKNPALRLLTVSGRSGVGKTAMICRILKGLEDDLLPDGEAFKVDGIVYLSANGWRGISLPNMYADLTSLLPDAAAARLSAIYRSDQVGVPAKVRALVEELGGRRAVVLLDNFEELVDEQARGIRDVELDEALATLLDLPPHGVKLIITTRVAARELALRHPEHQLRLDLNEGLPSPYAEQVLIGMDVDGALGLREAPRSLLAQARERTRGYPRALEALFAILSADRDTSLAELVADAESLPPTRVVEVLVGEAFELLDNLAQQVMQALAIYAYPVAAVAVDFLLQPYITGIDSAPVLKRLVNMHLVRKQGDRYRLHQIDRQYALSRSPEGQEADRQVEPTPFTRFALWHRGADYFHAVAPPPEACRDVADLGPLLAEFDLRCAGREWEAAARVLLSFDRRCLHVWGLYRQMAELHERLRGRLDDPVLRRRSVGNLGTAYYRLARYPDAIACFQEALVLAGPGQDLHDRVTLLGELGNCLADLGRTTEALGYAELALETARKLGDRSLEAANLSRLGRRHGNLGDQGTAVRYCHQAVELAAGLDDRFLQGVLAENLAAVLVDAERHPAAMEHARRAVRIGEELGSPVVISSGSINLGLACLYSGDLEGAKAAAETAQRYELPNFYHYVLTLLGVTALRQGDEATARQAFQGAVRQTEAMLQLSGDNVGALDARGLAASGLVVLGEQGWVEEAVSAFQQARRVNSQAGIVQRVVRLLRALAAPPRQLPDPIRTAASGRAP
jgi:tetratricopeptide (TPR) repeat protein